MSALLCEEAIESYSRASGNPPRFTKSGNRSKTAATRHSLPRPPGAIRRRMSPAPTPRVFTIPASVPFLPALVRALVAGELLPSFAPASDPLSLTAATLYLPTRRACRLAREVFLDVLQADAPLLPRIVPIRDLRAGQSD